MKFVLIFLEIFLFYNAVFDIVIVIIVRLEIVKLKFIVDYDRFIENIKDLNVLAGEGVFKIYYINDGVRFRVNFFFFELI